MRLLPARYKVVTATVDFALGEVGTVYQAAGFHYIGQMHQRDRVLVSYRGKRMAREVLGASAIRALARPGHPWAQGRAHPAAGPLLRLSGLGAGAA